MTGLQDPALDPDAPCPACHGQKKPCTTCNSTGLMSVGYDYHRAKNQELRKRVAELEGMLLDRRVHLNSRARSNVKFLEHRLEWLDGAIRSAPDDTKTFSRMQERRAVRYALEIITAFGSVLPPVQQQHN